MTLNHSFTLNVSIPHCPSHDVPHPLKALGYPSTTIIYVIYAVTTLVFATIIAFKYNSVKVFNKKIRTQNISNTLWIIYYVSVGIKACVNAALYGISSANGTGHPDVHGMLFDAAIILTAINAFTLCLSLNHQRKYRSSAPSNPAPQSGGSVGKETEPLLPRMEVVKRLLDPIEILFFVLFTASLILYYVALWHDKDDKNHSLFTLIFVGSYAVQRIPIFVLSLVIVAHRNGNEGPTKQSKVYLFFAAVFHLVNELPVFFLSQVLPFVCLGNALSWIDILIILNYVSLLLFFLFLRSEYLRNMEECIWTTVSQIQDTFDFRRF